MKNLLLAISLMATGFATQTFAATNSPYPAVYCACKRKDNTNYTMIDAKCSDACSGKKGWTGKAILSNSSNSITCICGDYESAKTNASPIDCSGGVGLGKCPRHTKWDGDFYSDKISEKDNMLHIDKSTDKKKDTTRKLYNKGFISPYED